MVPVDAYVAHVKKRWKKMPFDPLMDRLAELTQGGGLIVQIDEEVPADRNVESDGLTVTIVDSTTLFDDDFDVEDQDGEGQAAAYVDYRIKLG